MLLPGPITKAGIQCFLKSGLLIQRQSEHESALAKEVNKKTTQLEYRNGGIATEPDWRSLSAGTVMAFNRMSALPDLLTPPRFNLVVTTTVETIPTSRADIM